MIQQLALLALLAAVWSVNASSTCSLYAAPLVTGDTLFDYPTFNSSTPVNLTWTNIVNGALQLTVAETNGGTVGYAWHYQRERVADGFVSTFSFMIPPNNLAGDGFTYFIQNDKTVDLNGGSGDKLGAFGIAKSIAVRVDLCSDRPTPCNQAQIGLALVNSTFQNIPIANSLRNVSNLADGAVHTIVVTYEGRLFGSLAKLRVLLDNAQMFEAQVGDLSGAQFFGDRQAFFGFTASTSWTNTAFINILSWNTVIVPSDSAIDKLDRTKPFTFDFDTVASFKLIRMNSCFQPTGVDDGAVVVSTLSQQPLVGQDPLDAIKMSGNVTNNGDGTYTITYNLPDQLQAVWDLDISANGIDAEGMPFPSGVITQKPLPAGSTLPIWALILLLLLILLIILVLSYVVYRLYRYRKKLKENAEFIEAGKKQAELDRLEDGVAYSANRMVGTIDDLKSQLSKNEEELERLRKRGALGEDQNFTIEQLQKQRDALLEEMNRLKREEQEDELKRSKMSENFSAGGKAKKEFGREQI